MFPERLSLEMLANQPAFWQGKRIVGPIIKDYGPASLVEIETKFSKYFVWLPLTAVLGIWEALLIMLFYGWIITLIYEIMRLKGWIPDPMDTNNIAKGWLVGLKQFAFAKLVKSWGVLKPEKPHFVKIPAIALGAAICGGVVPVHHYIRTAGYSGPLAVLGNMAGRVLAIPEKFLEINAIFIGIETVLWALTLL